MISFIPQFMGYLASLLLAISLLVSNEIKFRWMNSFGSSSFIIYGTLINALPIVFTNSILLLINLFYLIKLYRAKEDFDLLEFNPDDKIIEKFLSFYSKDIKAYFPKFKMQNTFNDIRFVVVRDMAIANIFIASPTYRGDGIVQINYTVPKYRDYKVGKFIFEKENNYLVSKGINRLVYKEVFNKQHEDFLKEMGFNKVPDDGQGGYVKGLS